MADRFKLHPRKAASTPAAVAVPADNGCTLTAPGVAELICEGRFSAKWVIQKMGPAIGTKPGREWLFYENEARAWYAEYLEKARRRA